MASVSVHIEDMAAAIADGRVPGEFSDDRRRFDFPEVVTRGSRGVEMLWHVTVRLLEDGEPVPIENEWLTSPAVQLGETFKGEISSTAQQRGGKLRIAAPTYVLAGKNLGKKNATNVVIQAFRDALSAYNKHSKFAVESSPAAAESKSATPVTKPATAAIKPATAATKPATTATKPATTATKPATTATKPATTATKPATTATKPATTATKLATTAIKPATTATKPATTATKLATTAIKPATTATKPATTATKPATIVTKPMATTATKPTATTATKPATAAIKPATIATKPATTATKPAAVPIKLATAAVAKTNTSADTGSNGKENLFEKLGVPNGGKIRVQPEPMLVQKPGKTKDATITPALFKRGATLQRKYNGVRVVVYHDMVGDQRPIKMYSRRAGTYPGFEHLRVAADLLLRAAPTDFKKVCEVPPAFLPAYQYGQKLEDGKFLPIVYLDAEIYGHGKSLAYISGQARKEKDDGALKLVIYDCFFPVAKAMGHDMSSANRQKYLDAMFAAAPEGVNEALVRAENYIATNMKMVEEKCREFVDEGYEGGILRKDEAGYMYCPGAYHSSNLLKIKPLYDSEFKVVDFTQGKKGKAVGAIIWVCEVDDEHIVNPKDILFNVVPKNISDAARKALFECLSATVTAADGTETTRFMRDVYGLPLTVEYPERSAKTGKPTQAKALAFRTYEAGPDSDPIKKIMEECQTT